LKVETNLIQLIVEGWSWHNYIYSNKIEISPMLED